MSELPTYNRSLVFAGACTGMFLFGIVMISLGSLLPVLTGKFALDPVAAGSLAILLPFGILAGSLVFGPVVDRYGYRALLALCTLLIALGLIGIALASEYGFLQASIVLIGLGGGILNGATNALVSDISADGRGARLSLLGVFFGIGALGMPAILGLLSGSFSHESILLGIGLLVLLVSCVYWAIRFPVPKQVQGFPLARGAALATDARLLILGLVLFFESGMEGMQNTWTTTFLQQQLETPPDQALFALSCMVLGLTAARLLLGWLLKRISMWRALALSIACILAGEILLEVAASYGLAVAGLVLIGIGFAAVFPVILGAIGDRYTALSGTAFSIALTLALVGNMILNYLVGAISQSYGIRVFPFIMLAALCMMTLLVIAARRKLAGSHIQ
ncbi:MAG: MFS transporter [Bacteroidota bacterium]